MKNNMLVHQGYRYYTYIQTIKDKGKNQKKPIHEAYTSFVLSTGWVS
jgi:hypothetical protein